MSASQEDFVVRLMLERGMGALVPEAAIPKSRSGKLLNGGFFCVPKDSESDRLIYDKRPGNL